MSNLSYDPTNYNNGVPPELGLVWESGGDGVPGSWGWPTVGTIDGDEMIVTPSGGGNHSQTGHGVGSTGTTGGGKPWTPSNPFDKIPDSNKISEGWMGSSWEQLDYAQKLWLEAIEQEKAAAKAKAKAEADAKRLAKESARAKAEASARAKAEEEAKRRHTEEGKKIAITDAERKVRDAGKNIDKAQKNLDDRKRQRDALVKPRDDLKKELAMQEELLGVDWSLLGLVENTDAKLKKAQQVFDSATKAIHDAENELEAAKRDKGYAEITLNTAHDKQRQAEAEVARLADARKQAEAEAARKAEMQRKAEEEAEKKTKAQKQAEEESTKKEQDAIKYAIKTTADFYKELTEKFGEQSAKVAKELAGAAKGKTIKNADEALKAFEKYKEVLNKKFSIQDREAVAKALESVNRDQLSKNLSKLGKVFYGISITVDLYDVFIIEIPKAIRTQNWRPVFEPVHNSV